MAHMLLPAVPGQWADYREAIRRATTFLLLDATPVATETASPQRGQVILLPMMACMGFHLQNVLGSTGRSLGPSSSGMGLTSSEEPVLGIPTWVPARSVPLEDLTAVPRWVPSH